MSAWIALRPALPNIPEWQSLDPVRTRRSNAISPLVAIVNSGLSRSVMPPSRMRQASAGPLSWPTHSLMDVPPTSSSPSKAMRTFTGRRPSAASPHGRQHHVRAALVVGDSARVEPAVALDERERIGLPQVERRRGWTSKWQ